MSNQQDEEWAKSVEGVVRALAYLHGRATESGASASMNLLPIPTAIYWLRKLHAALKAEKDGQREMKRKRLTIDDDLLRAARQYVDKQLATMREHNDAQRKIVGAEYDELVYRCAEYPQQIRNAARLRSPAQETESA